MLMFTWQLEKFIFGNRLGVMELQLKLMLESASQFLLFASDSLIEMRRRGCLKQLVVVLNYLFGHLCIVQFSCASILETMVGLVALDVSQSAYFWNHLRQFDCLFLPIGIL